MCRIAYIPRPGLVEEQDLIDLFSFLEKKQGGEGNGLALVWPDNTIEAAKGLDEKPEDLAMLANYAAGPALFHTRRATSGAVCNELCQPFVIDDVAVVHNGMWKDWDSVALELILQGKMDGNAPINDSLTAAVLASKFGRYALETIYMGVFVIMKPEGAWLHLRGGSFEYCPDLGIYASEFPNDWPKTRGIRHDSIAFLAEDGPDFECGGWKTYSYTPGAVVVRQGGVIKEWKDGKWNDIEEEEPQYQFVM